MEKHGERDFDREWPKVKVSKVLPLGYNLAITKVMRYIRAVATAPEKTPTEKVKFSEL